MTKQKLWACIQCGCTDVFELAYVHMNTGEICSGNNPPSYDDHWCPRCDQLTGVDQTATKPDPL